MEEIFTIEESIKYFNLEGIGKSPSKLDMSRILSMNEHYIKNMNENDLFDQLIEYCNKFKKEIKTDKEDKIKKSLESLIEEHSDLDDAITRLNEMVPFDQIKLQRLKKRKLTLRDEIQSLQSLIVPDIIA